MKLGRLPRPSRLFEQGVALRPDRPELHVNLGTGVPRWPVGATMPSASYAAARRPRPGGLAAEGYAP